MSATGVMKQRVWRFWLRWRFRLFQRGRYRQLVLEQVNGRPFVVLPEVFNPALFRTSGFFVAQFADHIPAGAGVLDMGTGTGIGAVFAASQAAQVVAVDINPAAVRCARINILLNQREDQIEVQQGDLFAPLDQDQRFDVVLFNPPYFRGQPRDAHDYSWRSDDTVERFAAGLRDHLTPDGFALVVLSTDGDPDAFLAAFRENGFAVAIVAERDLVNEVLTVYKLRGSI